MRSKFDGETPSCYGEFGLELPYGDYALAMLVWSQQTAKAEQIFAITNGAKEKRTLRPIGLGFFLAPNAGLEPATT